MNAASPPAARLHDPVAHSHALGGFLAGAAVGLAAAVVIGAVVGATAAEVTTAGLATPLVVGAVTTVGEFGLNAAVGGKLMGLAEDAGQALGASSLGAPSGAISAGSPNVKINGLPAVRALDSDKACDNMYGFSWSDPQYAKTADSAYWMDEPSYKALQGQYQDPQTGQWDSTGVKNNLALPCYNQADTVCQGQLTSD